MERYDAVIVGSGPNGLAAAITIAREGRKVLVIEAEPEVGGGLRSAELTLPGYVHDMGSAVHPLAVASPFFRSLPLDHFGLEWIDSPASLAHAFEDGTAALMTTSVEETAAQFGPDAAAYRRTFDPLVRDWNELSEFVLGPPLTLPRHPIVAARFGIRALRSATGFAQAAFSTERAKAFFAGLAAHSMLPLDAPGSASFGFVLGALGHTVGWPIPKGGARSIAQALAAYLQSLGGVIRTGDRVETIAELPSARAYLFDTSPSSLARIAGERLKASYRARLERFKRGPGIFKMDWALDGPIPWCDPRCLQALTVHLGGSYADLVRSEKAPWTNAPPERPFVLLSQPTLFDPSRAPAGRHTVWAYLHVPNGSDEDLTDLLEGEIERHAPGFRRHILGRSRISASQLEAFDANLLGGDIGGGANTLPQILGRPTFSPSPYRTSDQAIFLCSASTSPGGGVHGMCGFHAARAALKGVLGHP